MIYTINDKQAAYRVAETFKQSPRHTVLRFVRIGGRYLVKIGRA